MIDIEDWQAEMLDINPWAREAWKLRARLVEEKVWNLNFLDQGGNKPTRDWLNAFSTERRQASLHRWRQGRDAWAGWAAKTRHAIEAFVAAGLWDTRSPGSPLVWTQDGKSALANHFASMPEYTIGFLMADILLLARADFSGLAIEPGADFSHHDFPAGAAFWDINMGDGANFEAAHFGDRTSFSGMRTQLGAHANFQKARFERADFTMAVIGAEANFADAVFGSPSDFQAATIGPRTSFERAEFSESVCFAGATIGDGTSFSDARFGRGANFQSVIMGRKVSFDRAVFSGGLAIPKQKPNRAPSFDDALFYGPRPSWL